MAEELHTQLAVIGGGPGGYPAAFLAADLGMQVTLVDMEENPGGVCLYRGCIPSKTLLHAAEVLNAAREAAQFGVEFGEPQIDIDKLRAWKASIVQRLTGGLGQLRKQRKVEFLRGCAVFTGPNRLVVQTGEGERALGFEHAIVATGSMPASIPAFPTSPRIMDSTGALELADIPRRMLVVGGGYIGLELGQAYASFGAEVSVVEMLPSLLSGADRDLAQLLEKRLKKQFRSIMLETRVSEVREEPDGVHVRLEGKQADPPEQVYDKLLVSVGRKPNSEGLGLEHTRVAIGEGGFIETDSQRRTAEASLFAIGDVAGQPMLAHKATHEARVAVDAIAGKKTVFDPAAIPAVVFTDPEIAWCGLGEEEAKATGIDIKVSKFPWAASGRAMTLGRSDGLTKIVSDAATGRILGVGITGPSAGEMIAEGVLAIEMGAVAEDLALTIHAHPTLSETVMEAAEAVGGHATHFIARKH